VGRKIQEKKVMTNRGNGEENKVFQKKRSKRLRRSAKNFQKVDGQIHPEANFTK